MESDLELVPDPLIRGADPDPHQNVTDPQHWFLDNLRSPNSSIQYADVSGLLNLVRRGL
jgi:hypothetical protein